MSSATGHGLQFILLFASSSDGLSVESCEFSESESSRNLSFLLVLRLRRRLKLHSSMWSTFLALLAELILIF